ncbi:NAD(P)/FAD-dependent oxidoreductase [Chryseobacterium tongliaoense]|uniref:NAD(P)/FAD-dependent oxidoreductase n=1 Tax=Chryseobacterium tongliaoense TaxID=3240933 RepID=UPI003515DD45
MPVKNKKKIVIIGGGFAGINLMRSLADQDEFIITLVDKNNYNFFPPLIYQVATGFLEPSSISYPFRKLVRKHKNVHFWLGEFNEVDPDKNKVILSTGELSYDYLVFATGTVSNYFGMENVSNNAIPMKTLENALNMRNLLLQRMEEASRSQDEQERKELLSIVIAGGGPTGVEVAGMLAEMKHSIFAKEYPELSYLIKENNLFLVDGASALLSPMTEKSQQYTYTSLVDLGVTVKLNTQVTDFDGKQVSFKDGSVINTKNLIWAAGVTGQQFPGIPENSYGRGKRLLVDQYNCVRGFQNIYAIGDISLQQTDPGFPDGHPQLAQVAIQQGKRLACNLCAAVDHKPLTAFVYNDKGSMAIVGRNKAVADISGKTHFNGNFAWFMWIFVHLMSLVNYRNRIKTWFNWSVAYITHDQSLRFIINSKNQN